MKNLEKCSSVFKFSLALAAAAFLTISAEAESCNCQSSEQRAQAGDGRAAHGSVGAVDSPDKNSKRGGSITSGSQSSRAGAADVPRAGAAGVPRSDDAGNAGGNVGGVGNSGQQR
jgi:hypothetical protein